MITSVSQILRWIAASALLAFATVSYSQDAAAPQPERDDRVPGRRLSHLMKYKIFIQDDQPAGHVVDFILSDGGCIDYLVATYQDQYYVIPYSATTVRHDDSLVFVDLPPARFKQVQFFGADNWPDFYVPAYRDRIFTTFGVDVIRRNERNTFRRDLGDDDDDTAERREGAQERREEKRDRRQDRRENRRDADDDANRDLDRPIERDRSKSKPAPKAKSTPKPDLAPKAEKKDPAPKPDAPLPPRVDPKKPPMPKIPEPKLPTPKTPANPKQPALK